MASLVTHTLPKLPSDVRWDEMQPRSAHGADSHGHDQEQYQDRDLDKHRSSGNTTGHDVATTLNYWPDPGNGALPLPITVGPSQVTNERPEMGFPVTIRDVAGEESTEGPDGQRKSRFTLDTHAFQWVRHESAEKDFDDEESIATRYFAETEQLLRDVTGASRVHVFDHNVRRGPAYWHKLGDDNIAGHGPLRRVHVDQSYRGAELVLRQHWPAEADELMQRRWQIINAWRPIRTILQDPLAVAESASVPESDLAPSALLHESGALKIESWAVRPNPAHRWYFKYRQAPDEVLLLKCFDSSVNVARRAIHSAFEDPAHAQDEAWRESVEVRALLFY